MIDCSVEIYLRSADIFVGREKEILEATELLQEVGARPLLNIHGPGGIGKTRLVARIRSEALALGSLASEIIDFYNTANQTELGLLSTLAKSLSSGAASGPFDAFLSAVTDYQVASVAERYSLHQRAVGTFRQCFEALTALRKVAIFFDTFDPHFAQSELAETFVSEHLPWILESDVFVVVAGRQPLESPVLSGRIESMCLRGFGLPETVKFAVAKYKTLGIESRPDDYILGRIVELSGGRPILIALAVDWILLEVKPRRIIGLSPRSFEETLISWIRDLQTPQDKAILYMSVLHRRFDQELLSRLLDLPQEECQRVFEQLARFSFVKYQPLTQSCILHDEMREMVKKYIGLPPESVREVRALAVQYYEEKIAQATNVQVRDSLIAEWIYNSFLLDSDLGFEHFVSQFEISLSRSEIELCRALMNEMSNLDLAPSQLLILSLYRAELLITEYRPRPAYDILTGLRPLFADDPSLTGRVLFDMGKALAMQGDMILASEYMTSSLAIFSEQGDNQSRQKVAAALGETYYWTGQYVNAIPHLELALLLLSQSSDPSATIEALGTLGNVRRRQGQHLAALRFCEQARDLAVQQTSQQRLANALRNLANIKRDMRLYTEATSLYEQALNIFRETKDKLGLARTLSEYAWCAFVMGDLDRSEELAQESIHIKKEYNFNNELATTYHTLFEITLKRGDVATAYDIIEQDHKLATQFYDGYMIFDTLHHLALLDKQLGKPDELIEARSEEMKKWTKQGYCFPLFEGRLNLLLGSIKFDNGQYSEAIELYAQGFKMIADLGGTATGMPEHDLMRKELKPLETKIQQLEPDQQRVICASLRQRFIEQGLHEGYPELLNVCDQQRGRQDSEVR